jgi:hypothetical protein
MNDSKIDDGGPAFPGEQGYTPQGWNQTFEQGMSLQDYYIGQALANPTLCTGNALEYELRAWFGDRGGITKYQIAAAQALAYANAMISARTAEPVDDMDQVRADRQDWLHP